MTRKRPDCLKEDDEECEKYYFRGNSPINIFSNEEIEIFTTEQHDIRTQRFSPFDSTFSYRNYYKTNN